MDLINRQDAIDVIEQLEIPENRFTLITEWEHQLLLETIFERESEE